MFVDFKKNNSLITVNFPKDWDLYDMWSLIYTLNNLENQVF